MESESRITRPIVFVLVNVLGLALAFASASLDWADPTGSRESTPVTVPSGEGPDAAPAAAMRDGPSAAQAR